MSRNREAVVLENRIDTSVMEESKQLAPVPLQNPMGVAAPLVNARCLYSIPLSREQLLSDEVIAELRFRDFTIELKPYPLEGATPKRWLILKNKAHPGVNGMLKFDKEGRQWEAFREHLAMEVAKCVFPSKEVVIAKTALVQMGDKTSELGLISQWDAPFFLSGWVAGHNIHKDQAVLAPEGDGLRGCKGFGLGVLLQLAAYLGDPDFIGKNTQNKALIVDDDYRVKPFVFDWVMVGLPTGVGKQALRFGDKPLKDQLRRGYFTHDPYIASVYSSIPAGRRSLFDFLRHSEVRNLSLITSDSVNQRLYGLFALFRAEVSIQALYEQMRNTYGRFSGILKILDQISVYSQDYWDQLKALYADVIQLYDLAKERFFSEERDERSADQKALAVVRSLYCLRMVVNPHLTCFSAEGIPLLYPQIDSRQTEGRNAVKLKAPFFDELGRVVFQLDTCVKQQADWMATLYQWARSESEVLSSQIIYSDNQLHFPLALAVKLDECCVRQMRFPELEPVSLRNIYYPKDSFDALLEHWKGATQEKYSVVKEMQRQLLLSLSGEAQKNLEKFFHQATSLDLDETAMVAAYLYYFKADHFRAIWPVLWEQMGKAAAQTSPDRSALILTLQSEVARWALAVKTVFPILTTWAESVQGKVEKAHPLGLEERMAALLAEGEGLLSPVSAPISRPPVFTSTLEEASQERKDRTTP